MFRWKREVTRCLGGLVVLTTACSDASPSAPINESSPTESKQLAGSNGPDEGNADIEDLLLRVLPALGDTPQHQALQGVLTRMLSRQQDAGDHTTDASRRLALVMLETLERAAPAEQHADLGVIRLVLDNRQ